MEDNVIIRDRFAALFRALSPPVVEPSSNLLHSVRELPEPYLLPSPWTTWLLFALVCYRRQQDWTKRVVRHYAPHAIPPSPEMIGQEQPVFLDLTEHGVCSSHVELECGCGFARAVERVSGEVVTFGLTKRTEGIFFEDSFYRAVNTLYPRTVLTRFLELHPSELTIWYGLGDLESAGLLEGIFFDGSHADRGVSPDAYHLSPVAVWHMHLIERFCQRWEDQSQSLWLAACIGDWLKTYELAEEIGAADILAVAGPRADCQRREREHKAQRSVATGAPAEVDRCILRDLKQIAG